MTNMIKQPDFMDSVKVCTDYSEVLKSDSFQVFIKTVIDDYCKSIRFMNHDEIRKTAGAIFFQIIDFNKKELDLLEVRIRETIECLFNNIIQDKPVCANWNLLFDFISNDKRFLDLAKFHFDGIGSLETRGMIGKHKFLTMFISNKEQGAEIDFTAFIDFLKTKIHLDRIKDFGNRVKGILGKELAEEQEDRENYSEIHKGKRYSIISYQKEGFLIANDNGFSFQQLFLYDNDNNCISSDYSSSKLSGADDIKWVPGLNKEFKTMLKYNFQILKKKGTRDLVLVDLDTGKELFNMESHLSPFVFEGEHYLPFMEDGDAKIFNFSSRKITVIGKNMHFEDNGISGGFIGLKGVESLSGKLYSMEEKKFIYEGYDAFTNWFEFPFGERLFSFYGSRGNKLFMTGHGIYDNMEFFQIRFISPMEYYGIIEIDAIPARVEEDFFTKLFRDIKNNSSFRKVYLNTKTGNFHFSLKKAQKEFGSA